jgi:hypothetical protein
MASNLSNVSSSAVRSNAPNYDLIKDFFNIFSKGIKTSLLYPVDNPIPKEFKQTCWNKLEAYLLEYHQLEVDVHNDCIKDRNKMIFKSPSREENLPGLLHRDGIRRLCFKEGLTREEWKYFFDDILTVWKDSEGFEDLVNLFWQRDFLHIEYEAVDDFSFAEIQEEYQPIENLDDSAYADVVLTESELETENPLEKLVSGDDSPSGNEVEFEQNKCFQNIFKNVHQFSVEEKEHIEELVREDSSLIIEFEAIDLLISIMATDKDLPGFDDSIDTLTEMFDRLLNEAQFPLLVYLLHNLKQEYPNVLENSQVRAEKLRDLISRSGDRIRFSKITNILNQSKNCDLEGVRMYLQELDWDSLTSMIWMLGELEYFPARRMVIQALVNKGSDRLDVIGNAVFDSRWYVIRNAILILGEIGKPEGLTYFKKPSEHSDPRVRWEVVAAVEKIDSPKGLEYILSMLYDPEDHIRRKVIDLVTVECYEPAFPVISSIIDSAEFDDFEEEERKALIVALASTGKELAVEQLSKIAKKWTPFSKEKYELLKKTAILALSKIGNPEALATIEKIASKKSDLGAYARLVLEKTKSGLEELKVRK